MRDNFSRERASLVQRPFRRALSLRSGGFCESCLSLELQAVCGGFVVGSFLVAGLQHGIACEPMVLALALHKTKSSRSNGCFYTGQPVCVEGRETRKSFGRSNHNHSRLLRPRFLGRWMSACFPPKRKRVAMPAAERGIYPCSMASVLCARRRLESFAPEAAASCRCFHVLRSRGGFLHLENFTYRRKILD